MARLHKKELVAQNALKAEEKWKEITYDSPLLPQYTAPLTPQEGSSGIFFSLSKAWTYG